MYKDTQPPRADPVLPLPWQRARAGWSQPSLPQAPSGSTHGVGLGLYSPRVPPFVIWAMDKSRDCGQGSTKAARTHLPPAGRSETLRSTPSGTILEPEGFLCQKHWCDPVAPAENPSTAPSCSSDKPELTGLSSCLFPAKQNKWGSLPPTPPRPCSLPHPDPHCCLLLPAAQDLGSFPPEPRLHPCSPPLPRGHSVPGAARSWSR